MKQKYIIGDLVKYKVGSLEFIAEITNTSKYGYCFKGVSDDISGILCKEFAKDIPLTPELLEKNGWREEKGDYINDNYHIRLCEKIDGYSAYKVVNDAIVWLRDIESVSDLQHLFFGLNLNSEMEV